MAEILDVPRRRGRWRFVILGGLFLVFIAGGATVSYYVEALWFDSLGYADVFWRTLNLQARIFITFFLVTFAVLYGSFFVLKPARFEELTALPIMINGQPIQLPVEPVLRLIAGVGALFLAVATGAGMMAEWPLLSAYWHAPAASGPGDPIFNRPLVFYLFTLPVWKLLTSWILTLAVVVGAVAGFFAAVTGGTRMAARAWGPMARAVPRAIDPSSGIAAWRGLSVAFAVALLMVAARIYLSRFERLFQDHTVFAGVTYTEANVTLTGLLIVAIALVIGAIGALANAVGRPRLGWLAAAVVPAVVSGLLVAIVGWYVNNFVVKPNELVRESPYIAHNIAMTRQAYGLHRITQQAFPAETTRRGRGRAQQSGHAAEHSAVGLARAAGHAPADPGNPHLLRLP